MGFQFLDYIVYYIIIFLNIILSVRIPYIILDYNICIIYYEWNNVIIKEPYCL